MTEPAVAPTSLYRFALVWTLLVSVIPCVFGVIMLISPGAVTTPGAAAADVFRAMAYRNFAFSVVLGAALFTQPKRTVGFLLVARGLTEIADGASGVFVTNTGTMLAPFVGGLGDLAFGWYFAMRIRRAGNE